MIGLPGVQSAGLTSDLPLARGAEHVSFSFREGSRLDADREPIGDGGLPWKRHSRGTYASGLSRGGGVLHGVGRTVATH